MIAAPASCLLCGETRLDAWRVARGRSVVTCRGCGLVFVTPQPSDEERSAQYLGDATSPADYYTATAAVDRETFGRRLAVIERHVRPGRLLDVGANVGTFVRVAAERGWTSFGLEPNPRACERARASGAAVTEGFLEPGTVARLGGGFDAVSMWDVIEHFSDPRQAVRTSAGTLRPGGVLSISTPDFDSAVARRFQVKPLEHLFYFTTRTLSRLVEAEGLRVVELRRTTRRRDLRSVLAGTTTLGPAERFVAKGVIALGLAGATSRLAARVLRDELWVLACRR